MAGKSDSLSVKGKLHYQCDRISALPQSGQDWSSWDMPDPLIPEERGHSVRIIPSARDCGWVVSLTGKKIIGRVSNISDEASVASQLTALTGAERWKRKSKNY